MFKKEFKETITGIMFILPGFLGFMMFVFIPVIMSFILSFTEWNFLKGIKDITFVGFKNYINLFSDEWFIVSYKNNLLFTAVSIPILTVLGLITAVMINKYIKFGGLIRMLLFIPYIASIVAVAAVWQMLLHPNFGPINSFLRSIGVENLPGWLTSFKWSLPSIMFIYIWQQLGYFVVVFIAGLKSIPEDIYEAAKIDGASEIKQFFKITVPMISPTTFFLVTMGIIGSFKVFDHIKILTGGGPGNSSSVMSFYIYKTAFESFDIGYANTLAWALFLLVFIVTIVQWKLQKKYVNML